MKRSVLGCIKADFCKKLFVGKLLTRSIRFTCFCTAQTSIFQQKFVKTSGVFNVRHAKKFAIFSNFVATFADFANGIVIFAPFPSRSTRVVTKVRTARRATGVTAHGGNLSLDSLLSTYLTAATLLQEMVPGIDTCPVRCPWEATTCTKTNHRRWSGWNEQYVLAYSAQSTSVSTN